jgi:hypothetical protein
VSASIQKVQRRTSIPNETDLHLDTVALIKQQLAENMSSRSHRKINFNVSEQYEIIDIIGEGAYGVVAYAILIFIHVNG